MSLEKAYELAGRQLGMNENEQRDALKKYMSDGGVGLDPAVTAWCAGYVNASLAQAGMQGTGSNMARSFMNWGTGVSDPRKGDIAVFSRGDPKGPYGHVGFFEGYDKDGNIIVLGGNQNDAVSRQTYAAERLLGFRRYDSSSSAPGADKEQAAAVLQNTPTVPGPRTSAIVPQVEDEAGQQAISKGIAEFLNPGTLPLRSPPPIERTGQSSRMSPLSGVGIPGLDMIQRYSTPGGIESLYRGRS